MYCHVRVAVCGDAREDCPVTTTVANSSSVDNAIEITPMSAVEGSESKDIS